MHKGLWTSPFPSFWYFHAGTKAKHAQLLARHDDLIPATAELAADLDALPSSVRAELESSKKRKNPKARKRAAKVRLAAGGGGGGGGGSGGIRGGGQRDGNEGGAPKKKKHRF